MDSHLPWPGLSSAVVEFRSAVRSRKMVRSFSGEPVSAETLDSVLEMAVRAPTAGNTAGREFIVLEGPETARYWEATTTEEWRRTSRRWGGLERAPVAIVVIVSPEKYLERYDEPDKASSGLGIGAWPVPYWFFDAGASVMALLLGASDAGLGACFLGNFRGEDQLLETLGCGSSSTGSWRFAGAVLIGAPGDGRPPISEIVHQGTWRNNPAESR
jgi:nitroreductase